MITRRLLLRLSRRSDIRRWAMTSPLARSVARRFVAGETTESALAVAAGLNQRGLTATLNLLGEDVTGPAAAERAAEEYVALAEEIERRELTANLSIKPSQMGLNLPDGPRLAAGHLRRVLQAAAPRGMFTRLDMEGSDTTQATLDLLWRLRDEGFTEVGPVIQAYLYRSPEDLAALCRRQVRVRLCKGAYAEPPEVAYPRKADVDAASARLTEYVLRRGHYPALATHDERLIAHACEVASRQGITPDGFEFQMLYGVRRDLQARLTRDGYQVRVYVPFGDEWYPYFLRRMAERPANLLFVLRSLAGR